jgi:phage/plasmid-like protein (TIGR03299 family)
MHLLESMPDGSVAFASARVPAWHQLGTVTTGCMTATEAITTAKLSDWRVRKVPVLGREATGNTITGTSENLIDAPDKAMTVRTNPVTGATDYLGVVGRDYTPVQNEACAELLDLLVDASGAHFETAGSLRGGRQVFITLKLPEQIRVAGVDDLDLYLAVSTSHDGSMALRVDATPVRVVCANTQTLSLKRSVGHYTFRHTTNVKTKISQARQAIGITYAYRDAFTAEAERMLNTELTLDAFRTVCEQLWPTPDPDAPVRTRNNHTRRARSLDYLFTQAPTQANIRSTAWAGLQSVVEHVDFYSPATDQNRRAERTLTSTAVATLKQRAHDLLTPTTT